MSSYAYGKAEVCDWVRMRFAADASVLDVGACDGNWRRLLPEYRNMDAVEAFGPNLRRLSGYRQTFHADIRDFRHDWYDLIIFGDVIEHLTVEQAQAVLAYAKPRCRDMIIAVPKGKGSLEARTKNSAACGAGDRLPEGTGGPCADGRGAQLCDRPDGENKKETGPFGPVSCGGEVGI